MKKDIMLIILLLLIATKICSGAAGISQVTGFPATYVDEVLGNMQPYTTVAFKIDRVIRTEDVVDGVQWRIFFSIYDSSKGEIRHSSLRIYALDNQVQIITADNLTAPYLVVTKTAGNSQISFRPYQLEIQMPPGVNIVEYRD